jgi:uncharacterized protein (TIGR03435 family)
MNHAFVSILMVLPAIAQAQTFAGITIKPARSADSPNSSLQVLPDGGLIARAVPAIRLLSYAYDVPVNPSPRLSGLPDWIAHEQYDIDAKAPANAVPGNPRQMIRQLLADRFRLTMRTENKSMAIYALTVASAGPKLQKSDKDCASETCHNFAGGLGHPLNAKAIDMDDLASYISNWTDLPVLNRTALSGLFTLHTEGWIPMRLPPPPPNATQAANPFTGLPTIFTVLSKLGLELKRQDEILPVYTIEHIERPATN